MLPLGSRRHGGDLRDKVLRGVFPCTGHAQPQIIGSFRGVKRKAVGVQIPRRNFQHRMGLLQRGGDVFGVPALDDKGPVGLRGEELLIGLQLLVAHQLLGLALGGAVKNGLGTAVLHLLQRGEQVPTGFLHLAAGQLVGNRLRTRLRLLPVMIAVADEVGRRGVAQLLGEILGQHLGLPDVGIVLRLIAGRIVVDLRWYIAVLLPDAGKKALGTVPDGGELRCL